MSERIAAWRWAIAVGLIAWLAVVATRTGPGVTSDEPFNVFYAKAFVSRFLQRGSEFFSQTSINETFGLRSEHPPLGRWLIGWMHWLLDPKPEDSSYVSIVDARLAPATAFAVMVTLVVRVVQRRSGTVAGVAAGVSLILMPRVFAHAHFAALDTFVACFFLIAVLGAGWMMKQRWPWLAAPLAGVLLGAVMLTKMHGLFTVPLVCVWAVVFFRLRSILPLLLWGISGVEIFFVGWPWLWGDVRVFWSQLVEGRFFQPDWVIVLPHTFSRLSAFLGSSMDRAAIYTTYLGRDYRDIELPWHYPWVLFAVTVPLGLHILGGIGFWQQIRRGRSDSTGFLFVGALMFPLIVFSVPLVPVYDGVRLFLMVFPFWAMFIGEGVGWLYKRLEQRWTQSWAIGGVAALLATQAAGLFYYHPFQLSYYNLLTGGLRGANKLGLEVSYWGDAVTPSLVNRWSDLAPEQACAILVPTLHPSQPLLCATAATEDKRQQVKDGQATCTYLIVYNRRAYLGPVWKTITGPSQRIIAENARDGVWLSRVYELENPITMRQPRNENHSE